MTEECMKKILQEAEKRYFPHVRLSSQGSSLLATAWKIEKDETASSEEKEAGKMLEAIIREVNR